MSSKPTTAFALSLVGSVFVLLGAASVMFIGKLLSFLPIIGGTAGGAVSLVGDVGLLSGVMMILGSIMMYWKPSQHAIWGAIVLVFSAVSWVGAFGGLLIGFILGLVGGILGITWKSHGVPANVTVRNVTPASSQRQQTVAQQGGSFCASCGSPLQSGARACSACGAPA
jgi:hypothetical protein